MSTSQRGTVGAPLSPASGKPSTARWWQARTAREQKLLGAGAVVVLAFAAWKLVLAPALYTISAAHERLPALRADAALAGAMALDAQTLSTGTPMVRDTGATLHEQLRAWLERAGLASSVRVVAPAADTDPARLALHIDNAQAAQLIRWLATLPETLPLTVVDAALARTVVDGRDQPGRISGAVALLARPEGESP